MSVQQGSDVLYLSRLIPNLRSREARQKLGNPSALYGFLLQAFDGREFTHHKEKDQGLTRGLLFRAELPQARESSLNSTVILIQSTEEPDWTFLKNTPDFLLQHCEPECKPFSFEPTIGNTYRFRLRGNPTFSKSSSAKLIDGKKPRGKVIPLVKEPDQRAWLERKLSPAATLYEYRIIPEGTLTNKRADSQPAKFCSALFEGTLQVTDAEKMRHLLCHGIGRGRGLGFGLLSLARVG